jgi:putative redox protein
MEGFEAQPRRGPSPMELVLGAVAGCTGIDVVSILGKMRLEIRSLWIEAEGERREEQPRAFRRIHLTYEIATEPPDPEKIRRAVELSVVKYCSVSATLTGSVAMSYTLRCHDLEFEGTIPDGSHARPAE